MSPRLALLLRAAVSASILILILSRTSLEDLALRVRGGALLPLAAALLLFLLMALLVALRWRVLVGGLGLALPLAAAVRAVFLGLFGGQLLPSSVGTDVLRGWAVVRHTGSLPRVAASLIADRLVALFAACLLLAAYPALGGIPAPFGSLLAGAAVLALGALLAVFVIAGGGALRRLHWIRVGCALALALVIHSIAVSAAALTASAYGVDASLGVWLAIIPAAVIASAVPVSINGWGVREGVIVALAAGHGIAQADALLVSLTLGVLNVLASLPGAYVLLRSRPPDDSSAPQRSATK